MFACKLLDSHTDLSSHPTEKCQTSISIFIIPVMRFVFYKKTKGQSNTNTQRTNFWLFCLFFCVLSVPRPRPPPPNISVNSMD